MINRRGFLKLLGVTGAVITTVPVLSKSTNDNVITDQGLHFYSKKGTTLTLDSSGNLGIGTTPSNWNTKIVID